ncbi:MAG: excinuclease ABC subunit UvrA [Proteobacteria bacterium]|nr:excinuclease ABC subunit UvrA [Pseudomonadota bacterium]
MDRLNLEMPLEKGASVRVRGAREHNLRNIDVDVPRDALVVFSGISGSGKSSLAFGTLYAEAQRRYLESVAPYARRLIDQAGVPAVDGIDGLPPAVALQQQRGAPGTRSTVGSVTTLSNLLRLLYSRAGHFPEGRPPLEAEDFSPNTPQGACSHCHGMGRVFEVTEATLVPDPKLTIRDGAVAAWPPAWHGQNLRDILIALGFDVDLPWEQLPREQRDWILFTEEMPTVGVYPGRTPQETRRAIEQKAPATYQGTFTSARHYVLHTFATTQSALVKKRVSRYVGSSACPICDGKKLKLQALEVTFAGLDIGALSRLPLVEVARVLAAPGTPETVLSIDATARVPTLSEERRIAARRIVADMLDRIDTLRRLGLGYLTLERSAPTLSPGELQRLRLATQIRSQLFGVVYVLDEPSAGLHPADGEALLDAMVQLRRAGNSVFVVEHDLHTIRRADWVIDVGPGAGSEGGNIVYSGPPDGLARAKNSVTGRYMEPRRAPERTPRAPAGWLTMHGVRRNNLQGLDARLPLGVMCAVTGLSGSGKSSLITQALVELVGEHLGRKVEEDDGDDGSAAFDTSSTEGHLGEGADAIRRLVRIDQRPIGRTPRSNLATYTGLFDEVRKLFAGTEQARAKGYDAGRFSFNVAKGRCPTCEGEGFVSVELLFMPSAYAPCPTCHGRRYDAQTLAVQWRGRCIADVLELPVADACAAFADVPRISRPLKLLRQLGLGYLRLGQPATELSGGEAQRIKLASEMQRVARGATLYVLDEPTTGLHPADVDLLLVQLDALVDAGHSVVLVEHDMRLVARCDWVLDMGPGAGGDGGRIVAQGPPAMVAQAPGSRTAPYLRGALHR